MQNSRISTEQNTSARKADGSPLVMNKMRIGKDGKTSEMMELVEDGESQWRNLERKFGSEVGEDGASSFCESHESRGLRWSS